MFCFIGVPNPTFCVPSQFVSWSAHSFEPPSETYVSVPFMCTNNTMAGYAEKMQILIGCDSSSLQAIF